jgi:hypothetical protein
MTTAAEALGSDLTGLAAALDAGVAEISAGTNVTFTLYNKVTLSQDGFVFWVATSQTMTVTGALHYATDRLQEQDQTVGSNQVLLTATQEITEFNAVAPGTMWIGAWPTPGGGTLQVVFSQRGFYFGPAKLWHYSGLAVYAALSAQIVQSLADLPIGPIVSNSLPIWLSMNTFNGQTVPVYPSFLVPDNIAPPYIVVHIDPDRTEVLQASYNLGAGVIQPGTGQSLFYQFASWQLMRDEVELTLYGFTNAMAIQYRVALEEYSLTTANFGFANSPAIQDAKRTQVELAAIAQKKIIRVSANYYQSTADAVARRYILSAGLQAVVPTPGAAIFQDVQTIAAVGTVSLKGTASIAQDVQTIAASGNAV